MNANDSIKRYSRQIILKEVGGQGQKLLMKSKVLIIGNKNANVLPEPVSLLIKTSRLFKIYGIVFVCTVVGFKKPKPFLSFFCNHAFV